MVYALLIALVTPCLLLEDLNGVLILHIQVVWCGVLSNRVPIKHESYCVDLKPLQDGMSVSQSVTNGFLCSCFQSQTTPWNHEGSFTQEVKYTGKVPNQVIFCTR